MPSIGFVIIVIVVTVTILAKRQQKIAEWRFKFFELRDRALWLNLEGHIPEKEAVRLHNAINLTLQHGIVRGISMTLQGLDLWEDVYRVEEKVKNAPHELREWYIALALASRDSLPNRPFPNRKRIQLIAKIIVASAP